jgi:ribose 5-phosphate isomerase B
MKRLLTERDVLDLLKRNANVIVIEQGTVITPLALDRIKRAGARIQWNDPTLQHDLFSSTPKDNIFPALALGSDHTGFKVKNEVAKSLQPTGITLLDVGCFSEESCDYPDFAAAVCAKILKNEAAGGILFDATGIPSAITANKFNGIRAAVCYNEFSALSARSHNNANILVVGARTLGIETISGIVKVFLNTRFEGGRHQRRLDKITHIEEIRK